jgi:hypothetical protein
MRVSRTVLREAEGVTPSAYSPNRNFRKGPEGRSYLARLKKPGRSDDSVAFCSDPYMA